MGAIVGSLIFAICLGVVVNYLVENKVSSKYFKHAALALAVAALGVLMQVLSFGQAVIVFLIVLSTAIILEEIRKIKEN